MRSNTCIKDLADLDSSNCSLELYPIESFMTIVPYILKEYVSFLVLKRLKQVMRNEQKCEEATFSVKKIKIAYL